ncbi:hypothetical protein AVEN_55822-1 [Araneus ventricosus]|uniref:Uncharacterized protein n=1 Tax=Araneus ventricosus TaxID=182803 RepID=A0A4Y2CPP3_ARAVE|nr:hypothetical protein AVEN_55822-1 [Araneus ventricosus]
MKGGGEQATLDDISRRHNLSNKKIAEIRRVVGAGGILQGLPIDSLQRRSLFSISFENGGWGGQATLDDISRLHKLSYEIKGIEIRRVVRAGELSEGFTILF